MTIQLLILKLFTSTNTNVIFWTSNSTTICFKYNIDKSIYTYTCTYRSVRVGMSLSEEWLLFKDCVTYDFTIINEFTVDWNNAWYRYDRNSLQEWFSTVDWITSAASMELLSMIRNIHRVKTFSNEDKKLVLLIQILCLLKIVVQTSQLLCLRGSPSWWRPWGNLASTTHMHDAHRIHMSW